MTNLTTFNVAAIAFGSSAVTSNLASYFDEYKSMFVVGVSIITCIGLIVSVAGGIYIKWAMHTETKRHHREMEGKD